MKSCEEIFTLSIAICGIPRNVNRLSSGLTCEVLESDGVWVLILAEAKTTDVLTDVVHIPREKNTRMWI